MKRLMRYRGLMVLVLWQAVPIGTDQYGRTRFGIGAGAGQLEYTTISCEGDVLEAETVGFQNIAGEVEHWLVPGRLRIHASAGHQWSDSMTANGVFGTTLLAYERQRFGIGAGVTLVPGSKWFHVEDYSSGGYHPDNQVLPSGYVRIGNRDRIHFRTELFPAGVVSPAEAWRAVLGVNQFDSRKPSGFIGMGAILAAWEENESTGIVGELTAPIAPNVAVGAHAFASPGRRHPQTGLTLLVRITRD